MDFSPFFGFSLNWSGIAISFFAFVLFFLLIREIVTWYWKINRIVNLLEKIEENTRKPGAKTEEEHTDALGIKN